MTMINKHITIIVFLMTIISCSENKRSQVIGKYENGKVKFIANCINDTVFDGVFKFFYENGSMAEEFIFENGLKEGYQKTYYENGQIREFDKYSKGLLHGICFSFFPSGKIKVKSNYVEDGLFGNCFRYYENGKMESYTSYNFESCANYSIKYDSNGKKTTETGTVLGQYLIKDYDYDTIPIHKPIEYLFNLATPIGRNVSVFIKSENDKLIEPIYLPIIGNVARYNCTYNKLGKQSMLVVGQIKDINGKILRQDSMCTSVIIR